MALRILQFGVVYAIGYHLGPASREYPSRKTAKTSTNMAGCLDRLEISALRRRRPPPRHRLRATRPPPPDSRAPGAPTLRRARTWPQLSNSSLTRHDSSCVQDPRPSQRIENVEQVLIIPRNYTRKSKRRRSRRPCKERRADEFIQRDRGFVCRGMEEAKAAAAPGSGADAASTPPAPDGTEIAAIEAYPEVGACDRPPVVYIIAITRFAKNSRSNARLGHIFTIILT